MKSLTLKEAQDMVYNLSVKRGLWPSTNKKVNRVSFYKHLLSEFWEANAETTPHYKIRLSDKPEGEAVELADMVMTIFSYFGLKGWDFENIFNMKYDYNTRRKDWDVKHR